MIRRLLPGGVALLILTGAVSGQEAPLRRRGTLGAALRPPNASRAAAEVRRVTPGSSGERAGLAVGDLIVKLNGQALDDELRMETMVNALRAGDEAVLEVRRGSSTFERKLRLDAVPEESMEGVEIRYGAVRVPAGYRLRTIVTRPSGATGRLPAVFLAAWLSCDSVEAPAGPSAGDGMGQLLRGLARSPGVVLFRVDKPGIGDSEGPPCNQLDFQSELAGYRAAFAALRNHAWIDPSRIFVLGLSNGGGFAPLVADGAAVAGYISFGGWAKTWLEHMMELERRRTALDGLGPGEVTRRMQGYAEFYADYLVGRMTPGEVIQRKPHLAPLWYDLPGHQYGRPAVFYHQLQQLNLAEAWDGVRAPVLVLYGVHDWIMSREDQELIVNVVNRHQAGRARLVLLPRTTHFLIRNETEEWSFKNFDSGAFDPAVVTLVTDWMKSVSPAPRN